MNLVNYMEDAVRSVLEEMLQEEIYAHLAENERVRLDVMAYTLNRLPPKYVATQRGHIYTRVQELRQQFKTDILVELTKAMQHVMANPRK
jgi:competence protein ComFB